MLCSTNRCPTQVLFQLIYLRKEPGEISFNIWSAPYVCDYPLHKKEEGFYAYLTLRSVTLSNNPQNNEMKFCENMKLTC